MTYPSDLNDAEWLIIEPLLPPDKPVGRPPQVDLRQVLNAIFYRADNGIKWRAMPIDFPPWQTVYTYYRSWVRLGIWEQINAALVAKVRVQEGRVAQPSLIISDSQSVKSAQKGATNRALMATRRSKDANVT
ncbi:MAG TPA: IS5 family transposase [Trichocoleus sp.]|jgi:transposase